MPRTATASRTAAVQTESGLVVSYRALCGDGYEESEGLATLNVTLLKHLVEDGFDRPKCRNEVEVACDVLVAQGRLVFRRGHGQDGRVYCSTEIPDATVELLREPSG